MATKVKHTASKASNKRPTKPSQSRSSSSSKPKSKTGPKPVPTQHKPKPSTLSLKHKHKKPPHLRYKETELNVPQLNGIRPAGVLKPPKTKKGKQFVDDKESMNAILAMVMAEKEGNIESKMMRARQMEEIREAKRLEAEKRVEGKRQGLEARKQEIKTGKKRYSGPQDDSTATSQESRRNSGSRSNERTRRVRFG